MSERSLSKADLESLRETSFLRRVLHFSEIDSTNSQAIRLLAGPQSIETPCLVYAESQTAGRGRGTNLWWSRPGSLTCSIIIDMHRFALPPDQQIKLPLLAGLAVLRSCQSLAECSMTDTSDFKLKWPNDVFLAGRKIAGILIEVPSTNCNRSKEKSVHHAVIGVGLNVNNSWANAPDELTATGISLFECIGSPVDRLQVLNAFLNQLEQLIRSLASGVPVLNEWSDHCLLTGKRVSLLAGDQLVTGDCLGLADNGALVIRTAGGTREFLGGVVQSWE